NPCVSEKLLHVSVLDARRAAWLEPVSHLKHDMFSALACVEDAGAIGEATGGVVEVHNLSRLELQHAHPDDGLRYFLSVGANILHRSSAYCPRNSAQTFDSGIVHVDGQRHAGVPVLAGCCLQHTVVLHLDIGKTDLQYQSGEAGVGDDEIAASAQHKQRQAALGCISNAVLYIAFGPRFRE